MGFSTEGTWSVVRKPFETHEHTREESVLPTLLRAVFGGRSLVTFQTHEYKIIKHTVKEGIASQTTIPQWGPWSAVLQANVDKLWVL